MKNLNPRSRTVQGTMRTAAFIALAAWSAFAAGPGKLPAFSLPDLEGRNRSNAEFSGQVVVVDFWATWCSTCKETVPKLSELQEKYKGQGLTVVGISVDKGSAEKIRKAAKKLGINYLVLQDKDNTLSKEFGFTGIPSLYVFDRSGGLLSALPGYDPDQEAALAATTVKALNQKP